MKKKICFVVAVPGTAHAFLKDHFKALSNNYEIHLAGNFSQEKDVNEFNSLGVTVHTFDIRREISLGNDIKALLQLYRIFKKEKFSCIHSVTPKAGLLCSFAGWLAHVPRRLHIYTGQVWATRNGVMRSVLKMMDRMIAMFDTNILVDGESQRQFLIKEGVLRDKNSTVLANGSIAGVKLNQFIISEEVRHNERKQLGITPDKVVYIFLGRLNHDKGIGELFVAFDYLVKLRPNSVLLLYGSDEGCYDSTVENYPNIKRGENYYYPGRTSTPFNALQAGDVYVLPTWREGFGMSIIEAQALLLPVITTDAYGVMDTIAENETGLRCKVGDVDTLLHCMLTYHDNSQLRQQHGVAGRKRVEDLFDNKVVSEAWVKYYNDLLK